MSVCSTAYFIFTIEMTFYFMYNIQEYKSTNNEEVAFLAASRAASTVIDAASAVEVSRYVRIMLRAI